MLGCAARRELGQVCARADARKVYANFEQPDLKAEFTFHVTAPAHWIVLSNQPTPIPIWSAKVRRSGTSPTPRMSTYLTAVAAGEYHLIHDFHITPGGQLIPPGLDCRQSLAAHLELEDMLTITLQGLDYFTGLFGGAFPYARYEQVFVSDHLGAMENVGCVPISEQFRPVRRRSSATLHGMLASIQQPGGLPELLSTNASGYAAWSLRHTRVASARRRAASTTSPPDRGRPSGRDGVIGRSRQLADQRALFPASGTGCAPGGHLLAIVGAQRYTGTERYLGADMFWDHADTATYLRWLEAARFTPAWNRFIPEGDTGHSLILAWVS